MKRLMLFACLMLLLVPRPALAHALGADWKIEGDKVLLEAYFSDNTPAQGAVVTLYNELDREKRLVEVKTDEKGACSFALPEQGKYIIVVDAGAGHRKELSLESQYKGPSRQEFTAYPWRSVLLGLCAIAGAALVFYLLKKEPPGEVSVACRIPD